MRRFLFLVLLGSATLVHAQNTNYFLQYSQIEEGTIVRLFADNVIVRSGPSTKTKKVVKLKIGFPVEILERASEPETILWGYSAPWYKVRFETDGMQTGYIWGGLIGWGHLQLEDGPLIVTGPLYSDDHLMGVAKAVNHGAIVDTATFQPFNSYGGTYEGSYGLQEVIGEGWNYDGGPGIFAIHMGYEACGYANGESYFFYVDKELSYGFDRIDVSDAGVFHCGEEIEWAAANLGTANQIKVTEECTEYEFDDETGDEHILSHSLTESLYQWNGKRLTAVYEDKEIAAE